MAQDYFISSVPDKGVGLYYTPFPKPTPCIASSCVAQPPQNSDFDGPVAKVRLVLYFAIAGLCVAGQNSAGDEKQGSEKSGAPYWYSSESAPWASQELKTFSAC